MSTYASFDGEPAGDQIASVTGWGDFGRWVEELDADDYPELHHLTAYGWEQELPALREQLAAALKDSPPSDPDTRDVADGLLKLLAANDGAEVLTVTGGMAS